MKTLYLMCLLICAYNAEDTQSSSLCSTPDKNNNVEGFYWRDYTTGSSIPSDALPGGRDDKGNPIYIAQTLFRPSSAIIPGQIRSTTKTMTFELREKEEQGKQDIKILCTAHPEHFQWIKTEARIKSSTLLEGKQEYITAGLDAGPVIVGRANHGNEVLVGKVIIWTDDGFYGVHVGKDGRGMQVSSFEVLVYNPALSKYNESCRESVMNKQMLF